MAKQADRRPRALDETSSDLSAFAMGRKKARKLFEHARKAETARNYDYAVELFVQGLSFWPDALNEGLQNLWLVATNRLRMGGKPPGFLLARKYPTSGKDHAKSLNNAIHLFGLNPNDLNYMEQILHLAAKAHCDVVAQWISPILAAAFKTGKKLNATHYQSACESMQFCADLAIEFDNDAGAMDILKSCIAIAQLWAQHYPDSAATAKAMSDASSKLTIVKGKFAKGEGFADSLKDGDSQHDLQDREKKVHTIDRNKQLVESARRDWEANRSVPNKLLNLVNMMIRIEDDDSENEAVKLLMDEHASSGNYIFKHKADEIQMRQLNRKLLAIRNRIKENPGDEALRQQFHEQMVQQSDIETRIYEDRVQHYPTDLKVKFELALRYFHAKRYDDAIPIFQEARNDAKLRSHSRLYIGRCFFAKGFYDQAVEILQRAVDEMETRTGSLANDLNYWLGMALESSGNKDGARKVFGYLIQQDYNYRDARQRLEKLVAESKM
ncbi:MAG: tetratricopeptide repeat protein [Planctomycetes bacterium]|nr:tetratricopeptide repeat protein [Planctomycetota bacterium]